MPRNTRKTQPAAEVKQAKVAPVIAKERKLYKPKTAKDFNTYVNQLCKTTTAMRDSMTKNTNKELLPDGFTPPEASKFDEIIESMKELRESYKDLASRKKRETSTSNYGLKTPQYMNLHMVNFVNNHGDLDDDLRIDLNGDKGVFDRISLTKFWVFYIKKHKLKDVNNKAIIQPDKPMYELFSRKIFPGGKSTYDLLKERIREIKNGDDYKSSNNSAKYNEDPKTRDVTGFNYAALQVLLAPFFVNEYTIPNQQDYIEKLQRTTKFFSPVEAQ